MATLNKGNVTDKILSRVVVQLDCMRHAIKCICLQSLNCIISLWSHGKTIYFLAIATEHLCSHFHPFLRITFFLLEVSVLEMAVLP